MIKQGDPDTDFSAFNQISWHGSDAPQATAGGDWGAVVTLVQFPWSGPPIHPTAIVSATLKYFVSGPGGSADLREVTEGWDAGTTWNSFVGENPGLNYEYSPDSLGTVNGTSGWNAVDVTATVVRWMSGYDNDGFLFLSNVVAGSTISSCLVAGQRPIVEVVYSDQPPSPPPTPPSPPPPPPDASPPPLPPLTTVVITGGGRSVGSHDGTTGDVTSDTCAPVISHDLPWPPMTSHLTRPPIISHDLS